MSAMILSKITIDPNVIDFFESHKFKVTRAIVQRELYPRNDLNQINSMPNSAAYRARKHVLQFLLRSKV